jgi:hypothetical protein
MWLWRKIKPPLEAAEHIHFLDLILEGIFGLRTMLIGGLAALMTMVFAAADPASWPVTLILLAALTAGALVVLIVGAMTVIYEILWKHRLRPKQVAPTPTLPVHDAEKYRNQAAVGRIELFEFLRVAEIAGWRVFDGSNLQGVDLLDGLRQAGGDGALKFWGRLNRFGNRVLIHEEPLVPINQAHWRDFQFNWTSVLSAKANVETETYRFHNTSDPYAGGYVDIHLERDAAAHWIETPEALSFRGQRDQQEAERQSRRV